GGAEREESETPRAPCVCRQGRALTKAPEGRSERPEPSYSLYVRSSDRSTAIIRTVQVHDRLPQSLGIPPGGIFPLFVKRVAVLLDSTFLPPCHSGGSSRYCGPYSRASTGWSL